MGNETKTLSELIHNELIAWCKQTGKKISQVPVYDERGKYSRLIHLVWRIRVEKGTLSKEDIALLNEYGMGWYNKHEARFSLKECVEYLIAWGKQTGKPLSRTINGKRTEISACYSRVVRNKSNISSEDIERLEQCGMKWPNMHWDYRIKNEIIPYCKKHNCRLDKLSPYNKDGTKNAIYWVIDSLKKYLKRHTVTLSATSVEALKEYGFDPSVYQQTEEDLLIAKMVKQNIERNRKNKKETQPVIPTLDELVKYVIAWCDKKTKYIYEIKAGNKTGIEALLTEYLEEIKAREKELTPEQWTMLKDYGITWPGCAPAKTEQERNIQINIEHVVYWCKRHHVTIPNIKLTSRVAGYADVRDTIRHLARMKRQLTPAQIEQLEEYGIVWHQQYNTAHK